MKIDLNEIYAKLKAWRHERGITAESQKEGYIVNVMEELGELATALREYEKFPKADLVHNLPDDLAYYDTVKKVAEHEIIDAICDICVFTINAGADIPCDFKVTKMQPNANYSINAELNFLIERVTHFNKAIIFGDYPKDTAIYFNSILDKCADICEHYGFNFEIAMLETIKEISSRTGSYDEKAKKWVKDESDEARAKWYQADYEKARLKNE